MEDLKTRVVKYKKGEFIFRNNDFSRDFYIIKSGKVRVSKVVGMRTVTLTDLTAGSVFGEVAAIDGGPRSANVVALEDTEVYTLDAVEFRDRTKNIPEWLKKISKILVQRLRETDERMEKENAGNSEYNAMLLFNYLMASNGQKDGSGGASLSLKQIKKELTDILNIKATTFSLFLRRLADDSLIIIENGIVTMSDLDKMNKYIKQYKEKMLNPEIF